MEQHRIDTLHYIGDMSHQLSDIARNSQFNLLAHILALAAENVREIQAHHKMRQAASGSEGSG